MPNTPTIQRVSPPYVVKALVPQPYGTYLVRYQTSNDEVISSIQMNNSSTSSSSEDQYVVLSIRVDETVYKCSVMNYRLTLLDSNGHENHVKLLEQYKLQQNKREKWTKLTNELILSKDNQSWDLACERFRGVNLDDGKFGGQNNVGVSKGLWKRPGQNPIHIFIKRVTKTNNHFDNELNVLKQLCFFPVITLYGHYSDDKFNYLVLADSGQSLQAICPIAGRTMSSRMRRVANIGFQIANAMIYLDKKNIVHRDLTAGNVLIDLYGFIRIADFGHAMQRVEGQNHLTSSRTKAGQPNFQIRFLAPECISERKNSSTNQASDQNNASFSSKSDVWAFGLLLIQLMIAKPSKPYPDIENDDVVARDVAIDRKIHPKPIECDLDVYYTLQQCWAYEPIHRISFTELRVRMEKLVKIFS